MKGPAAVRPAVEQQHVWFTIEHDGNRTFARCSCGWESARTRAAGLAGALWDEHAEEARRAERPT